MKKIAVLFFFAFLIRLVNLDQSLWLDEATTAMTVKTLNFQEIVFQFSPKDFHPPLYYVVMDLWSTFFGTSEIALRIPSVLFSLGAGWFVYLAASHISRNAEASSLPWFSTAFFLFNPLIIYYSQEARMYAMMTFFVAASTYYLIRKRYITMTLSMVLGFYTFYATIFFVAAIYFYLLYARNFRSLLTSAALVSVLVLPLVPLLITQFQSSRTALQDVSNWSQVLGTVNLKNFLLIPIKLTSGRISFEPKILYYLISSVWLTALFFPILTSLLKKTRQTWSLFYFSGTPLILGIMFSLMSPLLQYFRFQYIIIPLSILLAFCTVRLPRIILFIFLLGFVGWSSAYVFMPQFHREDWKSLAKRMTKTDLPIYMVLSSSDPLRYYLPNREVYSLKNITDLDPNKDVIIIPYTAEIHGVDYQNNLNTSGFTRKEIWSERGVWTELWAKD